MTAEYMFFSSMHVVLIKFTKCWVIKTSFNKFHNIDNKVMFSDHSGIQLEIKNKKITRNFPNLKN